MALVDDRPRLSIGRDVPDMALLVDPPIEWLAPYAAVAREDALPRASLAEVTAAARAFVAPALVAEFDAVWNPQDGSWRAR